MRHYHTIQRCQPLLGTYVEITLAAYLSQKALISLSTQLFAEIEYIQDMMSFHKKDSLLSYINTHAYKHPCTIPAALRQVLQCALDLSVLSDGLFDVTIAPYLVQQRRLPDHGRPFDRSACWRDIVLQDNTIRFNKPLQIDLGGIAKGYAVDRAFALAMQCDAVVTATINAGGDLRTNSRPQAIAIQHKKGHIPAFTRLQVQHAAVASSAAYYNPSGSDIVSPHTQKTHRYNGSVSVFADTCMLADALTKIVWLRHACSGILQRLNASAALICPRGNVRLINSI